MTPMGFRYLLNCRKPRQFSIQHTVYLQNCLFDGYLIGCPMHGGIDLKTEGP